MKKENETSTAVTRVSPLNGLASKFQIEPGKLLNVLRGTVIKPDKNGKAATDEEVAAFCIVAGQYGLNPFTREIHAFASGEKGIVPIVGIDGWTKLINTNPDFDGCDFEYDDAPNGDPISVTCIMHLKNRAHPVTVTEYYTECKRNTIPWNTMPRRMLRHKAYMQCGRLAFGLTGIYDDDEARDIINVTAEVRELVPMPKPKEVEVQPEPDAETNDIPQ
jgi:phage recombination protein Bet